MNRWAFERIEMKSYLLATLVMILSSTTVLAGQISSTFSESVFGVQWTDNEKVVQSKLPGGDLSNKYGYITYKVPDGREILKTKRTEKDTITFTFNSASNLIGIGVEFPMANASGFGELQNKLTTYFGQPESVPNQSGVTMIRWPEDDGVTISLSVIPSGFGRNTLLFGIEKQNQVNVKKEELGF